MAFAGYSSFASSDLPSPLPTLPCALSWSLYIHQWVYNVLQLHPVIGKHQQDIWGLEDSRRLGMYSPGFSLIFGLSSVTAFICLRPYLLLYKGSALLLYSSLWILRFLFSLLRLLGELLSFVARLKVLHFCLLISLNSVNNPFLNTSQISSLNVPAGPWQKQ